MDGGMERARQEYRVRETEQERESIKRERENSFQRDSGLETLP